MRRLYLIAIVLLPVAHAHEGTRDLMGITVRWESPSDETNRLIGTEITRMAAEGVEYYDPDCVFRKPDNTGNCPNAFKERSEELTRQAETYKEETLGYYDIHHRKVSPPKRDFGGVWQGDAIDQLRKLKLSPFIIDFSGDIFLSEATVTEKSLIITDAVFDELKYASVSLNRGFMIASVSKKLGGKVRLPDDLSAKVDTRGQVLKVVLFASPDFSGARLDAWSTGIIAGGTKVLEHLETLREFRDQWTYFYFEPNGKPHCARDSSRLRCDFTDSDRRVVVEF